jgi:signal transduction histidine kinase
VRKRTAELQKALAELKNTQRQVLRQERLAALGTMASGIAHDFKNTLTVIMGFSETLLSQPDTDFTKEKAVPLLTNILTATEDASRIVSRLREFYRPDESNEVRLRVNLNELVEQVISVTKARWESQSRAAGHPIYIETELNNIGWIMGDAAALHEALTNLIFNAVEAMPNGGAILLRTAAEGDNILLEISDTGVGMSEVVRERCLEPFFTTKGEKGTGLGLSMVFGIVRRHSGSLDLNSAPGEGTTFSLRFPVATEESLSAGPCSVAPPPVGDFA